MKASRGSARSTSSAASRSDIKAAGDHRDGREVAVEVARRGGRPKSEERAGTREPCATAGAAAGAGGAELASNSHSSSSREGGN